MKQCYLFFKTISFVFLSLLISFNSKAQTTLTLGDISIIGFNANAPDNFCFVSWVPLTSGTVIKFTDNGFLSSGLSTATNNGRGGENFVTWTNTSGGTIAAGTVIKIENGSAASIGSSVQALSGLSGSGDQIFAYQGAGAGTTTSNSDFGTNTNPGTFTGTILYGLNFQGTATTTTWLATGTPTSNTSYLPSELNVTNGNIALAASASRGEYTGSRNNQTSFSDYKTLVNNSANWTTGAGAGIITLNTGSFTIATNPTVSLSVSSNTGTEAGTTVITVTATTSAALTGAQTVDLTVTGTNVTAGDFTLSATNITIADAATTGTVTFTVVDDALPEGPETAVLTINNPSAGIILGSPLTQNIVITDNESLPTVNLSVSTNTASEQNATSVTITATASASVSSNQTVSLAVSGTGITASDYILSGTTITITSGQTTGTVSFKIRNDAEIEGIETAVLTISNPSSAITLGTTVTQNVSIDDNSCQPIIRKSTAASTNGAEISAFDPSSNRIFTVAGPAMEYYTLSNTGILSAPTNMPIGFTSVGNNVLPNSVGIRNGVVAVAYAIVNSTTNAQQPGVVAFYDAATAAFLNQVAVGYLPDMLIYSPDGNKIYTANEGEPNSYGQGTSFDPEGSVSIIDITAGVVAATVVEAGFTSFNSQTVALKAAGVRIYGPDATVAQDLEPEYIAFSADGTKAFVVLQENNAVAELNLATNTFTQIIPLGLKNHNLAGNGMDASDRDSTTALGKINIQNWPVYGMYQPDAMASFSVAGNTYYITANEGDSRSYTGYSEEIRVGATGYVLDPTVFPTAATLKLNENLGRLQLTNATGDTNSDGDFDELHALGARSFSIWNSSFSQVYDSGDQLEQLTAAQNPGRFNADNTDNTSGSFDTRSDNKGPEPEAVTTGTVNGVLYAFVGIERSGDIFVYDISNPAAPVFKQYIDNVLDFGVEGLVFVPADQSPTGKPLLISSAEVSKTVTVYEFSLVANNLVPVNTTVSAVQDSVSSYGDCTGLIAKLGKAGASPVAGSVTARAFIEATIPYNLTNPFVQRHYEIVPAANATTSTGRVTLYFTQTEFDNFNADPNSTLDLPANGADAAGKANLLVVKYPGESSNGTGLPQFYTGTPSVIDPVDTDIIFNSTAARWEVSFNVTGFSGFFVQTNAGVLPVTLLSFTAKAEGNNSALVWKTANEINHARYEIQYSKDGRGFAAAGMRNAANTTGEKTYSFVHENAAFIAGKLFYRLKMISTNGAVTCSDIVIVRFGATNKLITDLYPTPTTGIVNIVSNASAFKPISIAVFDLSGRRLSTKLLTNTGNYTVDISLFAKGIYVLEASLADGTKQQFKIVKQ